MGVSSGVSQGPHIGLHQRWLGFEPLGEPDPGQLSIVLLYRVMLFKGEQGLALRG